MKPVPDRSQIPEETDTFLKEFMDKRDSLADLGIFGGRFILELRGRSGARRYMVDFRRNSARPLHPEDSLKRSISMSQSHFQELVKDGELQHWKEALDSGVIRVSPEPGD